MPIPSRRSALVAALSLAVLLPAAGIALAGGGKPTKPPAKGAPAKPEPAAPAVGESLTSIESSYDDQETESHRALRLKRLDALQAYVKANGSAKDAEKARKAVVDLAEELEDWTKTVQVADEFVKAHPESEDKAEVLTSRAGALAALLRDAEAKTAYEAVLKDLKIQTHGILVWNAWMAYASLLTDMGDLEGAKKAYEDVKEAFPVPQFHAQLDGMTTAIEMIGKEPTAFPDTAKDLDGKALGLGDYKDKVVLVDFWATWCGPCRQELPHVIAAYKKFHDKGFEVVGISLDRKGDGDKLRDFIASKRMPWRQVYYEDGENAVAKEYNVDSIPQTYLIGKDGKILRIGLRGDALTRALEHVFGAPAAKPAK